MRDLDRKWWTLIAVCVALFMLLLDITVVNVALPSIQSSLHASFSDLQWVVDAYSLTLASFLLTAGVLGDIYGRRELFAIGLVIFTVSSLVCGLAKNSEMLNISRAVQGAGGAIMFATSLALIASAFHGRERAVAFGFYGAVTGGAVAVGPLVGGAITSGIGWRWIFFVNVPIGVVAVAVTLAKVAESRDAQHRRLDLWGFVTFSTALFLLVLALIRGNDDGWSSTLIVSLFVASAALLITFVVVELRRPDPMLDVSLFRSGAFIGVSAVGFLLSATIFAMFLYLTLYIQDDLGNAPFAAGLKFLPITLLSFVVAPIVGRITVRFAAGHLMCIGMFLVGLGLLFMSGTSSDSAWTQLLPGFVCCGIGIGAVVPVLASAAVGVVPPERSGMGSGANLALRQVGLATGIAVLGAVFQAAIHTKVVNALHASSIGSAIARRGGGGLSQALYAGQVRSVSTTFPPVARTVLLHAYRVGFSGAINNLLMIGAIGSFVGSFLSLVLVGRRNYVTHATPTAAEPIATIA